MLSLAVNTSSGLNNVAITLKNVTITNETNLVNQGEMLNYDTLEFKFI